MNLSQVPGVLGEIGRKTQTRVQEAAQKFPVEFLRERAIPLFMPKNFKQHMETGEPPRIIAEVKRASPSRGDINPNAHPLEIATQYIEAGAHALSVLTEPFYFKGDINFLRKIRERHPASYILMKDFMVDEYQFEQALWAGADAVLLIVGLIGREGTSLLLKAARDRGLTPLVEVHNESELEIALAIGAKFIGINNRNLKDMTISLDVTEKLASMVPQGTTLIGESGVETTQDIERLSKAGCHGFLIGSSLMSDKNPGDRLKSLRSEACKRMP